MSIEVLIGIAVTIVCGLIAVIYFAGQSRDDKQDARFERNERGASDHVREDASMHERVVRVETKVEALEEEVGKLRDVRHEILERTTRVLSEWYVSIMDQVRKLIDQVKK